MGLSKIIRLFNSGNVMVFGVKGSGKDMLFGNVICRRGLPYVSNLDYGGDRYALDLSALRLGSDYKAFLDGCPRPYIYPYPEKADIYISDAGVYFPCQYNSSLNKAFADVPQFLALCRQLGDCAVHTNSQGFNRPWDKIREQCDIFVLCRSCRVLFGRFVVQRVTVYDDVDAAAKKVRPFMLRAGLFDRKRVKVAKQQFEASYGKVRSYWLFYRNRSSYNTRFFRDLLWG